MKKTHYAWWVCAGCAMMMFITAGLAVNAFAVFPPFIQRMRGFTNAQVSFLITVRSLVAFLSSILAERYFRLLKLRAGMLLAGLASAAGFAAYGASHAYAGYLLGSALVGVGFGLGSTTPVAILIERWFVKDRTLAVSVCSAVTGLSTFGIPSLLTFLIRRQGLGAAFFIDGALIALMAVVSFALLRNDPADKGLRPYGEGEEVVSRQLRHGNVLLDRHDRLVLAPMALAAGAITSAGYAHLTVYLTSQGYAPEANALAITITGVALMAGKLLYGAVSERFTTPRANVAFGLVLIASTALMCLVRLGPAVMLLSMALYGTGLALTTVGLTACAAEWSVPAHYRTTVEQFQTGYYAGALVFSLVPGIIADHTGGDYLPAFVLFFLCSVWVVFAIVWTDRRKKRQLSDDRA